ncbi:hypothetical protein DMC30DRAFT_415481 [Rhodotorula diobovata]|uniref:Uncharacterized protein n=1 Tax=Rhodotorula diobovata TaxID=5288 RepID=A0A5C5FYR9_9BASI|nr:hypothetical protein DMC30DRAFT_415481 [Rhodotorula diobovata]
MDAEALVESSSPNIEWPEPSPFLRLPTELLDEVFCLSYQSEPLDPSVPNYARMPPHAHKPLCRRLYLSQRRALYSRVDLYSYRALRSFSRALVLDASGEQADLVRSLPLWAAWESTNNAPWTTVVYLGHGHSAAPTEQDEWDEADNFVLRFKTLDHELLAVLLEDKSTPAKLSRLARARASAW